MTLTDVGNESYLDGSALKPTWHVICINLCVYTHTRADVWGVCVLGCPRVPFHLTGTLDSIYTGLRACAPGLTCNLLIAVCVTWAEWGERDIQPTMLYVFDTAVSYSVTGGDSSAIDPSQESYHTVTDSGGAWRHSCTILCGHSCTLLCMCVYFMCDFLNLSLNRWILSI